MHPPTNFAFSLCLHHSFFYRILCDFLFSIADEINKIFVHPHFSSFILFDLKEKHRKMEREREENFNLNHIQYTTLCNVRFMCDQIRNTFEPKSVMFGLHIARIHSVRLNNTGYGFVLRAFPCIRNPLNRNVSRGYGEHRVVSIAILTKSLTNSGFLLFSLDLGNAHLLHFCLALTFMSIIVKSICDFRFGYLVLNLFSSSPSSGPSSGDSN